ncbi:acyl-CoA thioesterase [Nocardioides donggukensis]|uniref:Thioesterase family protein n=1 Tax=Nocardioides donggukensis TaxID=2774019 RepID=A0A927K2L2_9ACTN|nr:thioesterase family protein [Nocardioides donggukensis]MBD8868894.1 thioesterase family protein [Nocardioides donggukensis]
MRHVYECPVRWADLDLLGHVNNVTYVDYLQEARIDMLLTHAPDTRAIDLAEGVVVVRHEVRYLAPLTFRMAPVRIESWVTEIRAASFTMAYEVYDETEDGRVVYLRAKTVLTPYVFAEERPRRITPGEKETLTSFLGEDPLPERSRPGPVRHLEQGHYPIRVRFSDVDLYAHVNNVKYFEYFQEARIVYMSRLWGEAPGGAREVPMVTAQMDVDYRIPIVFRTEPYDVHSWVAEVGTSSFVIESEIRDGETLLSRARVVMVTFDPGTQRAAPAPDHYRELLQREVTRTS